MSATATIVVPENIKFKSAYKYVHSDPARRAAIQKTYYEANKERLRRVRRERYARQKAERLAAEATTAE